MFLKISETTLINAENIESVEKGSKLNCKIMMESGEKHFADIDFDSMVKILSGMDKEKSSLYEMVKNIDKNTFGQRGL